jgi:hypothetical protein
VELESIVDFEQIWEMFRQFAKDGARFKSAVVCRVSWKAGLTLKEKVYDRFGQINVRPALSRICRTIQNSQQIDQVKISGAVKMEAS